MTWGCTALALAYCKYSFKNEYSYHPYQDPLVSLPSFFTFPTNPLASLLPWRYPTTPPPPLVPALCLVAILSLVSARGARGARRRCPSPPSSWCSPLRFTYRQIDCDSPDLRPSTSSPRRAWALPLSLERHPSPPLVGRVSSHHPRGGASHAPSSPPSAPLLQSLLCLPHQIAPYMAHSVGGGARWMTASPRLSSSRGRRCSCGGSRGLNQLPWLAEEGRDGGWRSKGSGLVAESNLNLRCGQSAPSYGAEVRYGGGWVRLQQSSRTSWRLLAPVGRRWRGAGDRQWRATAAGWAPCHDGVGDPPPPTSSLACLGNGGFRWMEEDWRGFWEILTYNGSYSTPMPFIPLRSTDSQTSPKESSSGRIWRTRVLATHAGRRVRAAKEQMGTWEHRSLPYFTSVGEMLRLPGAPPLRRRGRAAAGGGAFRERARAVVTREPAPRLRLPSLRDSAGFGVPREERDFPVRWYRHRCCCAPCEQTCPSRYLHRILLSLQSHTYFKLHMQRNRASLTFKKKIYRCTQAHSISDQRLRSWL
jgi:hypothetical protein